MKEKKEEERRKKGVENCTRSVERAGTGTGTGLTVVAIALALALCVFTHVASAAHISVEPECQIIPPGEHFTVDIYVDPEGNETYAAEYKLQFNNTLVNATSQVNGSFLSQDGVSTLEIVNKINNTIGKIEYGETRQYVDYGVNTSGILATITFEALADGFCELGLYDVILSTPPDPDPETIPTNVTNGSVRIGLCGDVNSDKTVDMIDVLDTYDYFMYNVGQLHEWAADVNDDSTIDMIDVLDIYDHFMYGNDLNCRCGA